MAYINTRLWCWLLFLWALIALIPATLVFGMYLPLEGRIRQRGISPSFSCSVSSCQSTPHKRKTNRQTLDQTLFCPVLYALLHGSVHDLLLHTFTRLTATDICRFLIWHAVTCGNIRISPYMVVSLKLSKRTEQRGSPSLQTLRTIKLWNSPFLNLLNALNDFGHGADSQWGIHCAHWPRKWEHWCAFWHPCIFTGNTS